MPGFTIPDRIGISAVNANAKPFANFTWYIEQLAEELVSGALLYVRDFKPPAYSISPEEVTGSFLKYKYASEVVWEDCRITFYDVPKPTGMCYCVSAWIKLWRDKIFTLDGGLQEPFKYKHTTVVSKHNIDGQFVYTWKLIGSWPKTVSEGDLSYTNSDIKIVDVVLSYDWCEEKESYSLDDS